jgi:predicted MPP superfamily phosphohydrolase
VTEHIGFTHAATLGALFDAMLALGVLAAVRVVRHRRIGIFDLLLAGAVAGVAAFLQFLHDSEGFGRLHVAYLYVFVTLPIVGGLVLAAALVPTARPERWAVAGGGGLLLLGAVGFYATHIEPHWIRTERVSVDVEPLTGGDEIRVGVLADLQTDDVGDFERGVVDRLMAEEPDLILVAGDFFQSDGKDFEAATPELRELLGGLSAPGGVFVVEGDVDSPGRMAAMTDGQDLEWLDHRVATTEVRGHTVHIGGIPPSYGSEPSRATIAELAAEDPADLRILLTHRPDAVYEVPDGGADLVVAGHTHGGQVRLPWIGPLITMSDVPRDVAAGGLHELNGVPLYLSNGVGMERHTAPQVRFGDRPSIGIVTLR